MFRKKEFWKNFLKQYGDSFRTCGTAIFLSLTIFFIFFSPDTSDDQRNLLIGILIEALFIPFILVAVSSLVYMFFPYRTDTFRTSINMLLLISILSIRERIFERDIFSTFLYAVFLTIPCIPIIIWGYFKEKKKMTEYREKFSLYKNHLSDDEKKNNPVKAELFEIQHKAFDKIKQLRTTNPNNLKDRIENSVKGKLHETDIFSLAGVEAKHMKKCTKYTFDSDDINISLSEFKNKKSALSAFDQIPMSYIGIGTEPDGVHIIGEVFWSVKPDVENFSVAAFVFDRYAVCINAKTGFTINCHSDYGSPEFMCEPENSEKILSSAQKVLDILSDII